MHTPGITDTIYTRTYTPYVGILTHNIHTCTHPDVTDDWCTAGDIRVRYTVADPEAVSVIGRVDKRDVGGTGWIRALGFLDNMEATRRIMHGGLHGPDEMFAAETKEVTLTII